ncbi:X-X-X-Leu-X-X-Gly heptad repeat-containing protein, partial [human gut metagenome]
SELNEGLGELSSNSEQLNAGAKQVFDTLLSTAETQIKASGLTVSKLTIKNYKTELNKLVDSLDKDKVYTLAYNTALKTVTAEVEKNNDAITAGVTKAVQAKVLEGVLKAAGYNMTAEQYNAAVKAGQIPEAVQAKVTAAVSAQMATDAVKAQISTNVEAQKKQLVEQNMKSEKVTKQINEAVAKAKAGQT